MKLKETSQIEFSSLLFDTLFGLVLFFNIDLFLDIKNPWHLALYFASFFVLVHWWLIFRSADDAFEEEVTDSAADLIFGIIYLIFIDYIILLSRAFDYRGATIFLAALLSIDLVWALIWRYVGEWQSKDPEKIKMMEKELDHTIRIDSVALLCFVPLVAITNFLSAAAFVTIYILVYLLYIIMTFKTKIIDIKIF